LTGCALPLWQSDRYTPLHTRLDLPLDIAMADPFDPYREALVMEEVTIWPDEFDSIEPDERAHLEKLIHASPEEATELEYLRMHTGFRRQITVSEADLQRVR